MSPMGDPDVIVIGAGGVGPVAAKELAERGVKVLMLEAGPWLDPDRDFSLLEHDMQGIMEGRWRWGPADRTRPPWSRVRDGAGLLLQIAGVGGTTLHYNGISPRAFVPNVDGKWPLTYGDLVPWYENVESFLPVTQVSDLATKDAMFAEGAEKIGLQRNDSRDVAEPSWKPCYNAILPIADMAPGGPLGYPAVDGCTMCGHCLQGCPNPVGAPLERKAKRATNVSYVPRAVATGNCEIVPNAFATAIVWEERPSDGRHHARAKGVRWRDTETGQEHLADAKVVILAGGSIESPRLWLNSGLPNSNDAVGRRLTMHHQDFVTGFFDEEVNPNVGQVTMARADYPGYGTMWSQGYGLQAFAVVLCGLGSGMWSDPADGPWDFQGKVFGEEALRRVREYSRTLTVVLSINDESHPDNRVTLATDWEPDEHGHVPRVTYQPTQATQERQDWLAVKAAELLRAIGAKQIHRTKPESAFMTHLMGTMRMGTDPVASVVDADGLSHEVDNLYVADTSVIPSVGGTNPTLTGQALAVKTADAIAGRHFS